MRAAPLAFVLALAAACGDSGARAYVPPSAIGPTGGPPLAAPGSPGCGTAAKSGVTTTRVKDRTYTLVVPESYAPGAPYPLVFALHGNGGTGAGLRAAMDLEKQAAGKAIFVYPDAQGGGWDLDAPAAQNRDVALFDGILLQTFNALCIDSHRVFVTGFSNGAYMANQLGCRRGDRIRGIASHSGGGPYETQGSYNSEGNLVCSGKPVAALVIHGESDTTVPPSEGQKSIDHFSHANHCSSGAQASALIAPCVGVAGCYQPVDVCRIPALGHTMWKESGKAMWSFIEALR